MALSDQRLLSFVPVSCAQPAFSRLCLSFFVRLIWAALDMWYIWFALAVLVHIGATVFCAWRFRRHTAYCTVPLPEAFEQARLLAEATKSAGQDFKASDFMRFATTTYERWSIRPWVGVYFLAGFVVLVIALVLHLVRPDAL